MQQDKKYSRVLAIAGSDSGGCAGIQADVKAVSACGCFAATAITALTVQNTMGVSAVHVAPVDVVRGQVRAVLTDIGADAVKIGMLPTEEIILAVVETLGDCGLTDNVVLDPVMVATSGDVLVSNRAAASIIEHLMPMAALVTPNIPEAEFITGCKISSHADFPKVAEAFMRLGAKAVLLKAGHLDGRELTDHLFMADGSSRAFTFERIDTPNTHGTGCTLSSAIAAYLARGFSLCDAVGRAEDYLHAALAAGAAYRIGKGHGCLHHFYNYWE